MTDRATLLQLPPLSLYVHIPWCVRKCPYCDFNSHERHDTLPEREYVNALLDDLDSDLHHVQGRPLHSIFFGGGTPSLFSADAIGRILQAVNQRIAFETDIEITLEANPGTAEQQKFTGYRAAGVNRLSLGVQSFNAEQLIRLGRIHNADEAIGAFTMARKAGFQRCNIDLMHGLPGQSIGEAIDDLRTALDAGASHLSWYQLTIEPNTAFYKRPPTLPDDNILADIQELGQQVLQQYGLQQYEVSAYARPGEASRHNLNYWQFGDYLGIGAGAHAKITHPDQHRIERFQKTRKPEDYLARSGSRSGQVDVIDAVDLPLEFMMNALRLTGGFSRSLYSERTGLDWRGIEPSLARLCQQGLLSCTGDHIQPTALGRRFLNDLVGSFLPE